MTAKRRHWHEKDGRFWARIAIPKDLQTFFGKTQLTEPLGGDLRAADRAHAGAVARLQDQIREAQAKQVNSQASALLPVVLMPITREHVEQAVWDHYTHVLGKDEMKRAAMPTPDEVEAEHERIFQRIVTGEVEQTPIAQINASVDLELMIHARAHDINIRARRLAALRESLQTGETRLVDYAVQSFAKRNELNLAKGSRAWHDIAEKFARAEIEALQRTMEKDRGDFGGRAADLIVKAPAQPKVNTPAVPLRSLFDDYVVNRQYEGKHLDGGKRWSSVIDHLAKFMNGSDARKITKRDLLDWRDQLLKEGKSSKTVADVYLACIRAIFTWAFKNDRLPSNECQYVQQGVAKKARSREKGYTTPEAVNLLIASIHYQPACASNPANRESDHITAAKRWAPILCAFSGARITEITQMHKEDLRQEGGRWIMRIRPDAGSLKQGDFRDVPLHLQVVALGFVDFVKSAKPGPMFHNSYSREKTTSADMKKSARATSGRVGEWLNKANLRVVDVDPNHGWRHRFKTLGLELGLTSRVVDAIQGHAGKTAGDDYGDVTIVARLRVIDALPNYVLDCSALPDN